MAHNLIYAYISVLLISGERQTALYFCLAVLVISANLLVVVAVRYMKSAKKATIVFLCQLAVCNLVQGIIFLLKAFFFIWPVQVRLFLGCRNEIVYLINIEAVNTQNDTKRFVSIIWFRYAIHHKLKIPK